MALSLSRASAQIQAYVDFLHQYNRLPPRSLKRFADRHAQRAVARTLRAGKRPGLAGYQFSMVQLRSVSGNTVEAVLGIDRRLRPVRPLRAFVGHRFTSGVTNNLRHNLQLLCRPYGVSLWYSDTDMPNGAVFETIVQRIRQSDFCVFDDRETEVRPNVLIELGVAIGTGKPYFYLNYQKKRKVAIARRKEVITTASDLAGMLYMPYTSYEDVCLELAMRLPGFLIDRNLVLES
jgi:predicted nucleotide-binding protein with TIR-like domain